MLSFYFTSELDISEEGLGEFATYVCSIITHVSGSFFFASIEITSFRLLHLPLDNNGDYRFSTGSEMEIQCSRNNFTVSWQRQDGMCVDTKLDINIFRIYT